MPVDELITQPINLKDLQIHQPEQRRVDVKNLFSAQDWQDIKQKSQLMLSNSDSTIFDKVDLLSKLKSIDPQFDTEEIAPDFEHLLEETFPTRRDSGTVETDAELLVNMGIAYPELFEDYFQKIGNKALSDLEDELNEQRRMERWFLFTRFARNKKILTGEEMDLDEESRKKILDEVDEIRLGGKKNNASWINGTSLLADLRITFPDLFNQVELDDADWEGMTSLVERLLKSPVDGTLQAVETAAKIRIIAADKVSVKDQRLEVVDRSDDFSTKEEEMPQERKF